MRAYLMSSATVVWLIVGMAAATTCAVNGKVTATVVVGILACGPVFAGYLASIEEENDEAG